MRIHGEEGDNNHKTIDMPRTHVQYLPKRKGRERNKERDRLWEV